MNDLTIIIPAFNEASALPDVLPPVVAFCETHGASLIVVNDGSGDATAEVLNNLQQHQNLTVVHHKLNRGYGGAIKSGIRMSRTPYVITIDADGQHDLADVEMLYAFLKAHDADMVVGSRIGQKEASLYRGVGKTLIRWFARLLLPIHINDINSGMKIYDAELAKKYLPLCPDHMAFSDIIAMVFVSHRHRVMEKPITVHPRRGGVSTITTMTAIDTIREILNIVILFNPMRVFMPISLFLLLFGVVWGLPILLRGNGVSVGAMLLLVSSLLFFFLGLIAEQLSTLRKGMVER
ncbi:MAG: glycosyltransferase family 2 protein [Flavobacteriales bacterium]|nr:glycosyltransferase family 2 protein [Flavobacteriales bacterium]